MKTFCRKLVILIFSLSPIMSFTLDPIIGEIDNLRNQIKKLSQDRKKLHFWQVDEKRALDSQIGQLNRNIEDLELGFEEGLDYTS